MRKKEIEKRLQQTISDNVPDVLDNILAQCKEVEGMETMKSKSEEKKDVTVKDRKLKINFMNYKLVGALAAVVICLFGVLGFNQYQKVSTSVDSIINFDVNPSVEIKTNAQEKIVEANPLNDDGKKILADMDLEKVDLDVGVNAIIGSMLKNGYISEIQNSILVSVKNDDTQKAKDLETKLTNEINEYLNGQNIQGAVLAQLFGDDDAIEQLARENNISEGKANLISRVLQTGIKDSQGNSYTFESLAKLSINELNTLLGSKNVTLNEVSSTGSANASGYIGTEKAKEIAFNKAGVKSSNVTNLDVEFDCDNGILIYDVEFDVGNNEYDYEINAKYGSIVKEKVEKENNTNTKSNTNTSNTNKTSSNKTSSSTSSSSKNNKKNYDRYDDDRYENENEPDENEPDEDENEPDEDEPDEDEDEPDEDEDE